MDGRAKSDLCSRTSITGTYSEGDIRNLEKTLPIISSILNWCVYFLYTYKEKYSLKL